ncbi:MAG TPA: RagB/SusD family nutrient uptake outer membrane protein, partial [Flavisolibacter sp.]|nr:RagB/SusD family nutrient uptake outer membrane protein [Flavisolibacter sp.]
MAFKSSFKPEMMFLKLRVYTSFFFLLFLMGTQTSCKKYLQIPGPSDQLNTNVVFASDATATEAVLGIYHEMMNSQNQFTNGFTTLYAGLYADELHYYTPGARDEFEADQITIRNHGVISAGLWVPAYKYIYTANVCIQGLTSARALSPAVKNQLLGECYFIRSFCFFYLVNFFGDVPLTISTDYKVNEVLDRTPASRVLEQVVSDLQNAASLLPAEYPTMEKTRPNKWAAVALLSRVHLYLEKWAEASQ